LGVITFDSSLLSSYYAARNAAFGGSNTVYSGSSTAKKLPTPPWDPKATAGRAPELVKRVMSGSAFVNVGATQLDVPGSSDDYKKLFALYQGLNTLYGIAEQSNAKGGSSYSATRMQASFARGMAEIAAFTDTLKLDQLRLARGEVAANLKTAVGVPREKAEYVTGVIHSGSATSEVTAFQGPVVFDINIKRGTTPFSIHIDLADMGSQPRTLANVVNHINAKLQTAGVFTRFATERLPNEPRTVQVGDKTVTLPATGDRWAWKIKGDTSEQISFATPATSGAVYLAQQAGKLPSIAEIEDGKVDLTERQLLKFQTDTTTFPAVAQETGEANWVDGRVSSTTLPKEVSAARATATAADGSVYVLADITGAVDGQTLKGAADVALMKYDSAGNLIYSRSLGVADGASGYGLAVSADGKVAITGSVVGGFEGAIEGPVNSADNSTKTDSFVTLFNGDGEELWTVRRGARAEDEATDVVFGDDGTVYVAGRTNSSMPGAGAIGGWDGFLTAYATQADGKPRTLFTQQFGTAGDDRVGGLAIEGDRLIVAGVESGSAVLRGFDLTRTTVTTTRASVGGDLTTTVVTAVGGVPTDTQSSTVTTGGPDFSKTVVYTTAATAAASGVRSLGDMGGGDIAGVSLSGGSVVVAGSSRNSLSAGTETSSHGAEADAFVARLSGALTAQGSDRIAYLGGDGDDLATAMTVANGQVWIAGSTASTTLAGSAKLGTRDGFLARIDIDAGAADWSRRFTARDGAAAPTSIAVDTTGVSVLDRLGLPKGVIDYKDSQLLTSATSLRAGDQFFIRSREGARAVAITIAANDTLDTLATRIRRVAGYSAKIDIVKGGDFATLRIQPLNERTTVEIIAGPEGRDALESLGLKEGVVRTAATDDEDQRRIYGLNLSNDLNLSSKAAIAAALDQIGKALGKIRTAYTDLRVASQPKTNMAQEISGQAPAYLQAQIANYQAALARLTGGG